MEHDLCEAAIKGDTDSLDAIIQKDPLILNKFADGCFNGAASPLHVATSNSQTHFVEELLHRQPELTEVLDSQLRSALHLASAKGHDEIVKVLVKANSEMCLVCDREGKNPLHVAALKGKINALKELIGACPQAARERVDRNETILHLCVKHNQWKSLEILLETIQGEELVNAIDNDGNTILHLAIFNQRLEAGLPKKSSPTKVLDSQQRSALHLAMGHDQIVKELVKANPKMCLVRNREGKNPVHVAAMEGKTSVLEELVRASPQAARVRVDQNETILHLCVKHNQLESLKKLLEMIKGCDFVNAKDSAGNTILHIAILYEHFQIARHVLGMETKDDQNATNGCGTITRKSLQKIAHVLGMETDEEKETIDVNASNASGHTAMDVLLSLGSDNKEESHHVHDLLLKANAKQAKDLVGGDWLTNKRESLMVVASLIATMAFQAGVSPPGGVWQDDSKETTGTKAGYKAGEAVMAFNDKGSYLFFLRSNTIGFVASLSTILLLMSGLKFRNKAMMWILIVTMWLAITSMAITYAFSYVVFTPEMYRPSLINTIKIGVIVWSSVMALLLVKHTFWMVVFVAKERSRKWTATKAIKRNEQAA